MNLVTKKIILFLIAVVGSFQLMALQANNETIRLITDRNSCVSGDTIWFKTILIPGAQNNFSNIVHVQLDGINNHHITKAIINNDGFNGSGYIHIPDSLPTGTYLLKAFTNIQKADKNSKISERIIVVYNRFDNDINTISTIQPPDTQKKFTNNIELKSDKLIYKAREKVNLKIEIPDSIRSKLKNLIISAELYDPFASTLNIGNYYLNQQNKTNEDIIREKDGVVISGHILDADTRQPQKNKTVLLSVSDSIPYFDFYYSNNDGKFFFFLKEFRGTADIVLQTIPQLGKEYVIELFQNYINTTDNFPIKDQILTTNQKAYTNELIEAKNFNKHFFPIKLNPDRAFLMPSIFKYPFYGKPSSTIYTRDFIDLPNFQEISRELLFGSKYREKKDSVYIKIYNSDENYYFKEKPLQLLDGIPIFDTKILSNKKSNDIDRIDLVFEERYFGDMIFKGIIAVYSPETDLNWVNIRNDMFRYDFQAIQFDGKKESINNQVPNKQHIPDFRQVLLFKQLKVNSPVQNASFYTSDIKGDIQITLTAIMENGDYYITNRKIESK